jgi:hypothetical protein
VGDLLSRAATLAALFLLLTAASACASDRRVAPGGANSGDCLSSPCASLDYAYGRSVDGDVVRIEAGTYGAQVVPNGTKRVTFIGAPGNTIRKLDNNASNVTFNGLNLDAGGGTPSTAVFENHGEPGGRNMTFMNGRIGNVVDQKGVVLGGPNNTAPMNVVFDNVEFHDVIQRGAEVHNECVFSQAPGLTIRNSTFRNCATMDLFIIRGDWWGQQPYGHVTLENNVFGHSVNGSGWHYYGLYWSNDKFENVRVVNNTFENSVILDNIGSGPYSGVWANNIGGGWRCLPGVTYRNNVGKSCGPSDKAVNPAVPCAPPACGSVVTGPYRWVNPSAGDFHLRSGSPAIDAGSPEYAPRTDRDGWLRLGTPDAGAYEFGAGPIPGPGLRQPKSPGGKGKKRLRFRSLRLRPRVICKRARRRCPSSARLRVVLSRRARISVRVMRTRRAHRPRRVRMRALGMERRPVARLKARHLRRGRYRVRVVAVGPKRVVKIAKTRTLRVRR